MPASRRAIAAARRLLLPDACARGAGRGRRVNGRRAGTHASRASVAAVGYLRSAVLGPRCLLHASAPAAASHGRARRPPAREAELPGLACDLRSRLRQSNACSGRSAAAARWAAGVAHARRCRATNTAGAAHGRQRPPRASGQGAPSSLVTTPPGAATPRRRSRSRCSQPRRPRRPPLCHTRRAPPPRRRQRARPAQTRGPRAATASHTPGW